MIGFLRNGCFIIECSIMKVASDRKVLILKKLERHYNVSIDMPTDSIANLTFTASFNEDKALPEVLETFKQYYGIHYQINNNKVNIY